MKRELKKWLLPDNYCQDILLKFHNLRQKDIARYLGGLRSEIAYVVDMRPFWSMNDIKKLVLNVERQQKEGRRGGFKSMARDNSLNKGSVSTLKSTPGTKTSFRKSTSKGNGGRS
ncbi:hypothetical protein CRG98_022674 [Punica granatum]|uniref:Retrotransposon gag domain-containing protein n=1 Tax=Punica granatum TaxID=22663 RepID=A0A2I0JKY7_PUNGR|nr:hypothetical protein CRG98_022674 [Punica granatum]